ncbi:MAG TPA: hypothetical protein VGH99_00260 [Pseudonocardia sp.]|jgi:hypothetical protein
MITDSRVDGAPYRVNGGPYRPAATGPDRAGGPDAPRTADRPGGPEAPHRADLDDLKASLRRLLAALLERGFGLALDKVEDLSSSLDDMASHGGFALGAVFGGVKALSQGGNPVWGAIKGAVSSLSPGAKAALIAVLVLALLLLPVTVVLLLLLLIVLAVVAAVRTSSPA